MQGLLSVLHVKEGREKALESLFRNYAREASAASECLYIDGYYTKNPGKFVLLDMYYGNRPVRNLHLDIFGAYLTPESRSEVIRPVYSDPPVRRRPIDTLALKACGKKLEYEAENACGAWVAANIQPGKDSAFLSSIKRMGKKVCRSEPGFLYADLYLTDTPQRYLMIEMYTGKETLWAHQDLPHTKDFAIEKSQNQAGKLKVFTIRPAFSTGAWARKKA